MKVHVKRRARNRAEACEVAPFKAWKQRELRRVYIQQIREPIDLVDLVREVIGVDLSTREHAVFVAVNGRGDVLGVASTGGASENACAYRLSDALEAIFASVDPRMHVTAIYLAHNHPSGRPEPSHDDLVSTERAARAFAKYASLPIEDHVIVTWDRDVWLSLKQIHPELFVGATQTDVWAFRK